MKQFVILSGKGGTGKTSVTAAFAHLAAEGEPPVRAVLADADVDAANLELVLAPQPLETHEFIGGQVAVIDAELCQGCGTCDDVCRFDAIVTASNGRDAYAVDPIACEGCAACVYQCPEEAIRMDAATGRPLVPVGQPLWAAVPRRAASGTGELRQAGDAGQAAGAAAGAGRRLRCVIVDGPPGIGCPVISAASGADLALIVAEPTAAGIHDLERVLATTAHFRVPALVCINKADIYPEGTAQIQQYCQERDIEVVGHIPFDATVTGAMVQGQPVTAFRPDAPASLALVAVWQRIAARISERAA